MLSIHFNYIIWTWMSTSFMSINKIYELPYVISKSFWPFQHKLTVNLSILNNENLDLGFTPGNHFLYDHCYLNDVKHQYVKLNSFIKFGGLKVKLKITKGHLMSKIYWQHHAKRKKIKKKFKRQTTVYKFLNINMEK